MFLSLFLPPFPLSKNKLIKIKNNILVLYFMLFKALLYTTLLVLRLTLYTRGIIYECIMWLVEVTNLETSRDEQGRTTDW